MSWTRLIRLAELLTGNRDRAQDLVQSTLERVYLRWSKINADDPYGYVRRAVVNTHRDWWRRGPWRETATADPPERSAGIDHAGEHARRDQMLRALAGLTRRERAVIVLRYYEDLSETEIAAVLGVAPGTVKSTAARALAKLRISPQLSGTGAPSGIAPVEAN